MATRDDLRSAFLGSQPKFKSELLKIGDQTFELRQPSAGKRSKIIRAAGAATTIKAGRKAESDKTEVDPGKLQCHAIAELVYVPGTDDNVFGVADFDAMLALPTDFFDVLADKAMALMNVDREELAKN